MTTRPVQSALLSVLTGELVFVGYCHTSLLACLRPELVYPNRRARKPEKVYTAILRDACACPDEHVEVWVRRIEAGDDGDDGT